MKAGGSLVWGHLWLHSYIASVGTVWDYVKEEIKKETEMGERKRGKKEKERKKFTILIFLKYSVQWC